MTRIPSIVSSATCSLCGYSGYAYANHSFKYGSWSNYSDAQHQSHEKLRDLFHQRL